MVDIEEIAGIKGFAEITAENVVEGLRTHGDLIARLEDAGVTPRESEAVPASEGAATVGPLAGRTFCFTGSIERVDESTGKRYTRKQLQDLVKQHGGKSTSTVTKGLDFLVMVDLDSRSSKARKARELGTAVLSEDDFFAMLEV